MGTPGNGDNLPADGDRPPEDRAEFPELPALPDGVTVPDDLAALDEEADRIRAELASGELPPRPGDPHGPERQEPSLALPLLIMAVAVAITLVSLFAMVWSGSTAADRSGETARTLPSQVLTDVTGRPVEIAAVAPVVIILVESCDCADLIADTVAAAPPGVTVVAVGTTAPARPAGADATDLQLLADPAGDLRAALDLDPPAAHAATVVLADQNRTITHIAPAATTVSSYEQAMIALATR